jgi:hypothetical protein
VKFLSQRGVGFVVLVASLAALVLSAYSGYRSARYAHCQAAVNQQLVVAQNARAQAAAEDRGAMDRLVTDVAKANSAADTRAALARYQATRASADSRRTANPLPAPPAQTCD